MWVTVGLYTAALPYVILVFRAIDRHFSPQIAGKVPLFIIVIFAGIYIAVCVKKKRALRGITTLAAGSLIVLLIMHFETNNNKYIHIPEYILMSWILYQALAIDYRGRGILVLVLVCAGMLGIVDELLQGIHPQRTYGWKDMIINTASSIIGILMLAGVKDRLPGNWAWLRRVEHFKYLVIVGLLGLMTAIPMCIYFFEVQARQSFHDVYPRWLMAGNWLFLTAAFIVSIFFWLNRHNWTGIRSELEPVEAGNNYTALLWTLAPLVILTCMHTLAVWIAVAGINFR